MSEHNDDKSRERKREALAVMFVACGRGSEAVEATDVYLRAGKRIPADLYEEAVERIIETWQWPNAPQAGDIHSAAKRIAVERRMKAREEKQRREQAEMVADAMTPGQARELLTALNAQPEPESTALAAARELQMRLLAVAAIRDGGPKLVEEEVS